MTGSRRTITLTTAAAALTVPLVAVAAGPASADIDKGGVCSGARYELSVDREDGRFEVDADIDDAPAGSRWRVQLSHEGRVYHDRVGTTDREGDLDVETLRANTAGSDTFTLKVTRVGTSRTCSATIVTS